MGRNQKYRDQVSELNDFKTCTRDLLIHYDRFSVLTLPACCCVRFLPTAGLVPIEDGIFHVELAPSGGHTLYLTPATAEALKDVP